MDKFELLNTIKQDEILQYTLHDVNHKEMYKHMICYAIQFMVKNNKLFKTKLLSQNYDTILPGSLQYRQYVQLLNIIRLQYKKQIDPKNNTILQEVPLIKLIVGLNYSVVHPFNVYNCESQSMKPILLPVNNSQLFAYNDIKHMCNSKY